MNQRQMHANARLRWEIMNLSRRFHLYPREISETLGVLQMFLMCSSAGGGTAEPQMVWVLPTAMAGFPQACGDFQGLQKRREETWGSEMLNFHQFPERFSPQFSRRKNEIERNNVGFRCTAPHLPGGRMNSSVAHVKNLQPRQVKDLRHLVSQCRCQQGWLPTVCAGSW